MVFTEAPHWLDVFLNNFNTSPYFIGLMMLTMNLGSRFLGLEMSKGQETFFSHPWVRRFLIFVVFFIGTRNIWVAFWLAFTAILLLGYLFNENSSLCLFQAGLPGSACTKPGAGLIQIHGLTPEEVTIYKTLHEKQAKAAAAAAAASASASKEEESQKQPPDLYNLYQGNMERIKKLFNSE
jgi:hypothetical protein